jgi:hypothetical protein
MDKEKILKVAINVGVALLPCGLVAVGGYHAFKLYKKKRAEKKAKT